MGFIILLVILAVIVCAGLYVVPRQQAVVIERLGKYLKTQGAGLHTRIPFVDTIATRTSLRVQQLDVRLEAQASVLRQG